MAGSRRWPAQGDSDRDVYLNTGAELKTGGSTGVPPVFATGGTPVLPSALSPATHDLMYGEGMNMNRRTTGLLMGVVLAAASALHGSSPAPAAEEKQPAATNPFLETLVKTEGGVTIAYGTGQRSEEAAMLIFQAARAISSAEKSVKIMKAAEFDASHFRFTGTTHVIAVGTLADSAVLQGRNWLPTWWLDRDWYCNEYKYAVQPEKALPYQPKSGFVVAGFGEWPKGDERIGYSPV